jgi:hypothetical protein
MNKILLLLFALMSTICFAQDKIILNSGRKLDCKILDQDSTSVKIILHSNKGDNNTSIEKKFIQSVIYKDSLVLAEKAKKEYRANNPNAANKFYGVIGLDYLRNLSKDYPNLYELSITTGIKIDSLYVIGVNFGFNAYNTKLGSFKDPISPLMLELGYRQNSNEIMSFYAVLNAGFLLDLNSEHNRFNIRRFRLNPKIGFYQHIYKQIGLSYGVGYVFEQRPSYSSWIVGSMGSGMYGVTDIKWISHQYLTFNVAITFN